MTHRSSSNYWRESTATTNNSNNNSYGRGVGHKKYIPKTPNSQSQSTKPQTLSSSLRNQPNPGSSHSSRVRLGESGEWVSRKGNFVNYLPQDEAVAIGLGADQGGLDPIDSQRVVDLLNRELSRLLQSNSPDFWRQVAEDTSLHWFLDSFLQFRSRWYDFPHHGAKGTVAGVIVGDFELSRRVFMVLYRISSNRDSGACATQSLSKEDHKVLLQEKKILDLPKLLDICALYGHENVELTRSLVMDAVNAQPEILGSLSAMISHFSGIAHTMYQRCSTSLEIVTSAAGCDIGGVNQRCQEYLEVMDFLNDAVVSMDRFISAYRAAAVYFSCLGDASQGNVELISILATLHDSLLPILQQGLQIVLTIGEKDSTVLSDVSISLRILSVRIVDLGWKLLDICYLSDESFKDNPLLTTALKMFPASVEDPVIRADILVQTFKEITSVPQYAQGKSYRGTFVQSIDKSYGILRKIQSLQEAGWLSINDEQYHYLAGILTQNVPTIPKRPPHDFRSESRPVPGEEDAVIAESMISQVKDLFPDYGKGFISACLEVYDNNPEEVIQRILKGTLHEDLQRLDHSIETLPPKPAPITKKDKGKGILLDSTGFPPTTASSLAQTSNPDAISSSVSLSNSAGRFIRKSTGNMHENDALVSRDEKHMEKTAALVSQYEYEDEYDDSFDDLGLTIMESSVEETETLSERMRSSMTTPSRDGSLSSTPATARWNSRKKPQFYVKDGQNYSYKVEGSIAVADERHASLITSAQKESIHGLGRGGNRAFGAVKELEELNAEGKDDSEASEADGGDAGRGRGRGRRGGGGRNHYRKDRAMKKHMAGLGG